MAPNQNSNSRDENDEFRQRSMSRNSDNLQGKSTLEVIAEKKEDEKEDITPAGEKTKSQPPVDSFAPTEKVGTPNGSGHRNYHSNEGSDFEVDPDISAIRKMSMRDRLCQIFTEVHQSMIKLADQYDAERKKVVYITPTLFTQLFPLFGTLLARKNESIELERSKYEQGVNKLDEAKVMIAEMNATLDVLEPQLVIKQN